MNPIYVPELRVGRAPWITAGPSDDPETAGYQALDYGWANFDPDVFGDDFDVRLTVWVGEELREPTPHENATFWYALRQLTQAEQTPIDKD